MSEITVGPLTAADVEDIYAIEAESFATPWSREVILRDLTINACARHVAVREDGRVIAYAGVWFILDEGHITNIAVRSDRRGQGYGEMVTRAMIQLAADSGMSWMTLEVRRSNEAAIHLYHKLGFTDVGFRKRYYENREDALIMVLEHLPEGHPENDPFLVVEEDGAE